MYQPGLCAGEFAGRQASDVLGRKKLLFICAFLLRSRVCAQDGLPLFAVYFFRILSGVAVGAAALVCPMYTAEISPAPLRGRMVSFYQLAITTGILLAYLSNYFLLNTGSDNWRWMFTSQSLPALLFMAGLFTVPRKSAGADPEKAQRGGQKSVDSYWRRNVCTGGRRGHPSELFQGSKRAGKEFVQ
jgi:MFS family permease